jgi:ComF family protein
MLLDLFFPRVCLLCRAGTKRPTHLCLPCERELPILPEGCLKCADACAEGTTHCPACEAEATPYDRSFACFSYEGQVAKLITDLKFHANFPPTHLFSHTLLTHIQTHWYQTRPLPTRLLPLPLHPKRLKTRGFNQALEIARPLARALPLTLDTHSLVRLKDTAPQSGLGSAERALNMSLAFSAVGSLLGEHVAILDDVMTTGQTLTAAALAAKAAGAATVDLWCVARTRRAKVAETQNNR